MSHQAKKLVRLPAFGALLLLLAGCGEPNGEVSGKVTYNGAALTSGSINFNLKGKGIAQSADLDAAGTYKMAVPMPTGTYQVYYLPPPPASPGTIKPGGPASKKSISIPDRYRNAELTDLSFVVKAGKNDIAIDIKD